MSSDNASVAGEAYLRAKAAMDVKNEEYSLDDAFRIVSENREKDPACRYLYALFRYTGTCTKCDRKDAQKEMFKATAEGYEPAKIADKEMEANPEDVEIPLIDLRFRAEQRDTVASRKLFPLYDTGKNPDGTKGPVRKNHAEAVRFYMACADDGDTEAQNTIGYMYLCGKGVEKNKDIAIRLLSEAADHGCAQAAYRIGYMYDAGQCYVDQDLDKAVEWYQKAADLGYPDADYQLTGIMFMKQGKWFDPSKAQKHLIKAADGGNRDAMRELGTMYAYGYNNFRRDPKKADAYLLKACEAGDQQAMINYANLCFEGQALPRNLQKAAYWFEKAAKEYNGQAQYALGCFYGNGYYYEQDNAKAAYWFQEAAEGGEPNAQYALACFYYEGRGVEKDNKKAAAWFQEAAEQGHPGAMAFFGMFKVTGKDVEQDIEGGVQMLKDAADNGYVDAQFYLGKLYAEGEYVEKNIPYAKKMLSMAAKQGDGDANAMLAAIKAKKY